MGRATIRANVINDVENLMQGYYLQYSQIYND